MGTGCTSLDNMIAYTAREEAETRAYMAQFSMKNLPPWSKASLKSVSQVDGTVKVACQFGDIGNRATLTIDRTKGTLRVESYRWLGTQPAEADETIKLTSPQAKEILAVMMPKVNARLASGTRHFQQGLATMNSIKKTLGA